jgi:hypothetical protein
MCNLLTHLSNFNRTHQKKKCLRQLWSDGSVQHLQFVRVGVLGRPRLLLEVAMKSKQSILETVAVLALLGILAGAIAGLGIGAMTGRSSSTTSGTSSQ